MKSYRRFALAGLLVAALMMSGSRGRQAAAQGDNLLVNGSLERPYYGQGAPTRTAPQGWTLWVGAGAPDAVPYAERTQVRDGEVSWQVQQAGAVFTAAAYQRVTGLAAGDSLTASAYAWAFTCHDPATQCAVSGPPYRQSDQAAGVALRIGLDPAGGTDPNAPAVVWSAPAAPYDGWAQLSVGATAQGDAVTVFLFMTQANGLAINQVYWDQAALVRAAGNVPAAGEPTAPFVTPQGVRPDGSLVHIVKQGDTLSSIAFAYNKQYGTTVLSIAELNEGIKPNTRWLTVGQELVILPPGSVDPTTGQLIPPDQRPAAQPTPTPTATAPVVDGTPGPTGSAPQPTATPSPTATSAVQLDTEPLPPLSGEPAATEAVAEVIAATEEMPATPEATEEVTPEATEEAAVEPAAAAAAALISVGLAANAGALCVTVYDDANLSLSREAGEPDLPGAAITLAYPAGAQDTLPYEGGEAPLCLDLPPGTYTVSAALPDGYGLTTAGALAVTLVRGRAVAVEFGGAAGYVPPSAPGGGPERAAGLTVPPGAAAPQVAIVVKQDEKTTLERLYDYAGLFVLGFAGVLAISSALLVAGLRRLSR